MDVTASVIAFFALGANLLGAALLLLFNPRNREVHWYIAFLGALCLWLLAQGMDSLDDGDTFWDILEGISVMLLPVLFLASAIVERRRDRVLPWVVVGIGIAVLPIITPAFLGQGPEWIGPFVTAWHLVGWIGGSALLFRTNTFERGRPSGERFVMLSLLVAVPVLVAIGMIVGNIGFFLYVLPLLTVVVQFILFVGIVRLRFYDIEVRAARTGELAAQAAASERLALLGEISASIAHEVRNPLTGMRSLAQRLAEEDVDADKRRKYAGIVLDEVARLERMVSNLLGVARRSPPTYSTGPTALAPLFDDLGLLVASQAAGKRVSLDLSANGVSAAAPREALAQALLNLLLNAIAYTPDGGRASLHAREAGDGVVITVRDSGRGIAAAERGRIFQPFTTSSEGGLGLGLSLVRRLADELGWRLEVDDAPGGGAELRIMVPSARAVAPAPHKAGSATTTAESHA